MLWRMDFPYFNNFHILVIRLKVRSKIYGLIEQTNLKELISSNFYKHTAGAEILVIIRYSQRHLVLFNQIAEDFYTLYLNTSNEIQNYGQYIYDTPLRKACIDQYKFDLNNCYLVLILTVLVSIVSKAFSLNGG